MKEEKITLMEMKMKSKKGLGDKKVDEKWWGTVFHPKYVKRESGEMSGIWNSSSFKTAGKTGLDYPM